MTEESEGFAVRSDSLILVSQRELNDLKGRIASTRWPRPWPTEPWPAGSDLGELRRLTDYWGEGYDGPAQEEQINELPSYTAEVQGQKIHFLRFDSELPDAPAVLLTNGWPSTFLEMVELVPAKRADPRAVASTHDRARVREVLRARRRSG